MTKELTCIMCPVGCSLKVQTIKGVTKVTGNSCPRGAEYGAKEVTAPERILTTVKNYKDGTISLKSSRPVPKNKVDDCLKFIATQPECKTAKLGKAYIKNILGLKVDILITGINL